MSRWEDSAADEYEIELDERWLDEEYRRRTYSSDELSSQRRLGQSFDRYGLDPFLSRLCIHAPQCLLRNEAAGWSVFAGAGPDCTKTMGQFDLLLNLTGQSVFDRHQIPIEALKRWEQPTLVPEIVLDWPDMGVIALPREFWVELVGHLSRLQARMLVFCIGGHGRTGTAIASIMAACGWESADAIAWVRANYCTRAVETVEQEQYVRIIAGEVSEHANPPSEQGRQAKRRNR